MAVKDKKGKEKVVVVKEKKLQKDYIPKQKGNPVPSKKMEYTELITMLQATVVANATIPSYTNVRGKYQLSPMSNGYYTNVPIGIWKKHIPEEKFSASVKSEGKGFILLTY